MNRQGSRTGPSPEDVRVRDRRHVWHPWAPLDADRSALTVVAARGCSVWDIYGREYLDCSSLNTTVGFGRAEIIEAIAGQLGRSPGTDISIASHDSVGSLAERIAGCLPETMAKTLFVNSGSEAFDAAVFIAASYWSHRNETRRRFVTFARGYHGSTLASRSLTGLPRVGHPFADPFPVTHVELPLAPAEMRSPAALDLLVNAFERAISDSVGGRPAAVIVEPFLNVGGGIVLPDGFLPALRTLCDTHDTLLAVDEVFTAYGRCGAMFASVAAGVAPDILVSSKGLASGYAPIAAVTVAAHIHYSFSKDPFVGGLRYGHTTSGHAPACAAALATIDILEREGLPARAAAAGRLLRENLEDLAGTRGIVDVRGVGLIGVVEMESFARASEVVMRAKDNGLLLRQPGEAIIVCPPLIIDDATLEAVVRRLRNAIGSPP